MGLSSDLFTRILTTSDSPFVVTSNDGLVLGSLKVSSGGAGTLKGTKAVKGLASEEIPLSADDVFGFSTSLGISSFTITITSGTIIIVGAGN